MPWDKDTEPVLEQEAHDEQVDLEKSTIINDKSTDNEYLENNNNSTEVECSQETPKDPVHSDTTSKEPELILENASVPVDTINDDSTNAELLVSNHFPSAHEETEERVDRNDNDIVSNEVQQIQPKTNSIEEPASNTEQASTLVDTSNLDNQEPSIETQTVADPQESNILHQGEQSEDTNTENPSLETAKEEVPTFLDDVKLEAEPATQNEPVPTFLDDVKLETEPVVGNEEVPTFLDDLKLEAEPVAENEPVPTFLDDVKLETEPVVGNEQVSTFLDDLKLETEPVAERENVPTFLDEAKETTESNIQAHDTELPNQAAKVQQAPTVSNDIQLSKETTTTEDLETKNFIDEVQGTNNKPLAENIELEEVPTFLDDIHGTQNESKPNEVINEVENTSEKVPTFLDEENTEEHVPTFLEEKQEGIATESETNDTQVESKSETVPTFLEEIQEPKAKEVNNIKEMTPTVLDELSEDTQKMPWDEEPAVTTEDKKQEDAFAFLEDTTNDDILGEHATLEKNDDTESVKSFSFLEDEFEPLLEDEAPVADAHKSHTSQYAPKHQPEQQQKEFPTMNPYAPQQKLNHPTLKPKKSFFEELPSVSATGLTRLTTPAKSNPYASIVHQQQQVAPSGPPPAAVPQPMLPPKNPYAPSASTVKQKQEDHFSTPAIPQPVTAKDSLPPNPSNGHVSRQSITPSTAPRSFAPPRSVSRASSTASKSFFEELPILKSPVAGHTPKNPYAPLVSHHHPQHQNPYGMTPQPPPSNPYGIAQSSHRRLSSHGSIPPQMPPQMQQYGNTLNPTHSPMPQVGHVPGSGPPPPPSMVPRQQFVHPHDTRANSIGNRSRASSYLPASHGGYAPVKTPTLAQASVYAPPTANIASPKQSKYAPQAIAQNMAPPPPSFNPLHNYAPANQIFTPTPQQHQQQSFMPPPQYPPYHQLAPLQTHTLPPYKQQPAMEKIDNFQVPPHVELHKQFPIFRFNRSKKIAKVVNFGSVEIVDLDSINTLTDLDKNFGPLSKSKTKKATVESWIDDKIKFISENDPSNFATSLIYSILKELIKGDGIITDKTPIIQELSKTSSYKFSQGASIAKHSITALRETVPKETLAFGLFSYLQEGKKDEGLQYLVAQKEWPLSFIVASLTSPDSLLSVVNQYLLESFSEDKNSTNYVLYFVLNILSGNVGSIINLISTDESAFNYVIQNFSVILSLVLQNGSNLTAFYVEFGSFLIKKNMTLLGQALLLLSSAPLSELEIQPGVVFSVVGANSATDLGFNRSIDVMILTEIYEYALKLSATTNIAPSGFPHLIRLKVSHAALLTDNGCYANAQKYTDYLSTVIKAAGRTIKIEPSIITVLEDINSRITDTGETGWFGARPKLFGMLDKGFSKFIAGEDTTPAAKAAENGGLFTNYSPAISRTQSVADFGSPGFAQVRPPYGHSNSFIGFDTSAPSSGGFERRESNPPSSRSNKYNPASMAMSTITNSNTVTGHSQFSAALAHQGTSPYAPMNNSISRVGSTASLPQQYIPAAQLQNNIDSHASHQAPNFAVPHRAVSPSLKSEYNDDLADVRSNISKTSNFSRYAPVLNLGSSAIPEEPSSYASSSNLPHQASIAGSASAPPPPPPVAETEARRQSYQSQASGFTADPLQMYAPKSELHSNFAPVASPPTEKSSIQGEVLPTASELNLRRGSTNSYAAKPEPHKSYTEPYGVQSHVIASPPGSIQGDYPAASQIQSRRDSTNSYAASQILSPSLPRKSLTYSTPAPGRESNHDLSNASFAVAEDSHLDIYGETPSKVNAKTTSPVPVNPYALPSVNRPKKSNRYAPPPLTTGQNARDTSIDAITTGDIDIYSYGGYSRPDPSLVEAIPEEDKSARNNFEPISPRTGKANVVDPISHDEPVFSPTSNFTPYSYKPPSQSFSPRIPSEFDDDYNDDVVEDEDEDEEEKAAAAVAAAAAKARAEAELRKKEEEARKREEELKNKEAHKSGWFGGIFGRNASKEDKKVFKAKLGEQSNFYYDEKLKRWVNKDSLGEVEELATPPPPPPTIKIPKKPSDTPLPPSAVKAAPPSAPPPASSLPPPGSALSTPPPGGRTVPSRKATPGDIDDILNMASSSTRSTARSKRGPRRGYVDVMNQ